MVLYAGTYFTKAQSITANNTYTPAVSYVLFDEIMCIYHNPPRKKNSMKTPAIS
jgi:hypothetical protein